MHTKLRVASVAAVGALAAAAVPVLVHSSADAAAFTGGHLVVYRVGDGTGALSNAAAPVFLDEYGDTSTPVRSIALPTSASGANHALTASGQSRSEGQISRSADGSLLAVTGYDAAPGTLGANGASLTATDPSAVGRVVGLVDSTGAVDTRTSLTGASTPYVVRSAVTGDGTRVWVAGGNGGVLTTTTGSGAAGVVAGGSTSNLGGLTVQGGQLWTSGLTTDRLAKVGSGQPTSGASLEDLPVADSYTATAGLPKNLLAGGYALLDLTSESYSGTGVDTLYLANEAERAGTIDKFVYTGGAWQRAGYLDVPGATGLVAARDGSGVSLAVTTPTKLLTLRDTDGAAPAFAPTTPSTLATAPSNTEFRGVALAPTARTSTTAPTPTPTASTPSPTASTPAPPAPAQPTQPPGTAGPGRGSWLAAPATHTAGWGVFGTGLSPDGRGLVSGKRGAAATVNVYGSGVTLSFATKKAAGIVNVYVDGALTRVNLRSKKPSSTTRSWSFPQGVHTVQAVVPGPKAKAKKVYLGAFQVN